MQSYKLTQDDNCRETPSTLSGTMVLSPEIESSLWGHMSRTNPKVSCIVIWSPSIHCTCVSVVALYLHVSHLADTLIEKLTGAIWQKKKIREKSNWLRD